MKIKVESSLEKRASESSVSPWYSRQALMPIWALVLTPPLTLGLGVIAGRFLVGSREGMTKSQPQTAPSAVFLKTDTATGGSWKGHYGSTGFALANEVKNLPPFAEITLPGTKSTATWVASTAEARALQKLNSDTRIAATWYAFEPFTVDVNFRDQNIRQLSLYLLDWDSNTRVENVEIIDSTSKKTLDFRQAAKFHDGQYLAWQISGHVIIRITPVTGANAVVSGLFLD